MAKRVFTYADAAGSSAGLMRCQGCGKKITTGQFRYWLGKKGAAYLSEHRACSEDDPVWAAGDAAEKEQAQWDALPAGTVAWALWMPGELAPRQVFGSQAAANFTVERFAEAYAGAMLVPLKFKDEGDDNENS
jgi:hypothetical protein